MLQVMLLFAIGARRAAGARRGIGNGGLPARLCPESFQPKRPIPATWHGLGDQPTFCRAGSLDWRDGSSSTILLTISIVASSAGNNISNASSDSVTSVGVPKIVVVFSNETVPSRVAICKGVA